jgi:hypothetical protein
MLDYCSGMVCKSYFSSSMIISFSSSTLCGEAASIYFYSSAPAKGVPRLTFAAARLFEEKKP